MSQQSKSLADKLRAKEATEKETREEQSRQQHTANQKILRDDGVLKKEAPELWNKLSDEIRQQCAEFNKEPGVSGKLILNDGVMNRITVSYPDAESTAKTMRVSYDHERKRITLSGLFMPQKTPALRIAILPGESAASIVAENQQPIDIELTVDSWLHTLLGVD